MYSDYWLIWLFSNPPKIVWEPMGADYPDLTVYIVLCGSKVMVGFMTTVISCNFPKFLGTLAPFYPYILIFYLH